MILHDPFLSYHIFTLKFEDLCHADFLLVHKKPNKVPQTSHPVYPCKLIYVPTHAHTHFEAVPPVDHIVGISTALICFMTSTLARLFVYFAFRCKAESDLT